MVGVDFRTLKLMWAANILGSLPRFSHSSELAGPWLRQSGSFLLSGVIKNGMYHSFVFIIILSLPQRPLSSAPSKTATPVNISPPLLHPHSCRKACNQTTRFHVAYVRMQGGGQMSWRQAAVPFWLFLFSLSEIKKQGHQPESGWGRKW